MIYFDNAATTLEKPQSVTRAVTHAMREMTTPGRGGHRAARLAAETAYQCRESLAELFRVPNPERIVFTHNATHALNIAIKSLIAPGERAVISGYEHNSVWRPLAAAGAEIVIAEGVPFAPEAMAASFAQAITADTRLVAVNHVSNAFGYILPITEIAALCRERGVPFVLDASQSAGILEIDAMALGAAFIAMPGHKGLYAPQGTGVLICGTEKAKALMEGGTGSDSLHVHMPKFLPDRLEAGTHNMPGIAGLLAGVRFVQARGVTRILRHEQKLANAFVRGLRRLPGTVVYTAENAQEQAGVVSFNITGANCETIGAALAAKQIATRTGLHCSPLAHQSAGTQQTGTVRVSFSVFNTMRQVERCLRHLGRIAATGA